MFIIDSRGNRAFAWPTICAFLSLAVFFFQSCNQRGNSQTSHGGNSNQPHSAEEPAYKAGLRLQPGMKYYYTIDNATTTNFEVNDKSLENTNSVKASLIYEVLKDTAGGFLIRMTYDHFKVVLKTPDSEKDMDSDSGPNAFEPVERMLGLLKGSSLLITISANGRVKGVEGYKELTDKIMNSITVQNPADKQKMQAQLENMFGQGFIKNNMEQGFSVLPDTAVYVGDSWTKKQTQLSDIKISIASTYTLKSIDDHVAVMDASGDINNKDSSVNLMGYQAAVNFEGTEQGTYKADLNTGMLISGESDIAIKGNVQIQFRDVPMRIKIKKLISVKRI